MLRGAIICPNQELRTELEDALAETHRVGIVRALDNYPNDIDLVRFLRAAAPEIVFLSVESSRNALELVARIEAQTPGTQIVAVHGSVDPETLVATMRAGIRAFLPSKAGVGCSTVALNTSIVLSQLPETKTLLADFDLNCGMIDFMLQMDSPYAITSAVENAHQMDENLWEKLVTGFGELDVIPA